MNMLRYIGRRLLWTVGTLLLTSIIIFTATRVLPGDVATLMLGTFATPESLETLRQQLGLNDPPVVQYMSWLGGLVSGDLGESTRLQVEVAPLLWERLKNSLILAGMSLATVVSLGLTLGTVAALRRGGWLDRIISMTTLVGISVPEFVTGSVLIVLTMAVLPPAGFVPLEEGLWPFLQHLILPVATLTMVLLAHVTRMTRASVIETLQAPYVRTAVLKGMPTRTVIIKHALRTALLPTLTVIGINLGYMIGGMVVVETVFAYPGLGRLMLFAVEQRDIPVLQATAVVVAGIYLLGSLVTDLLYAYLNPKLRTY